MITNQDSIKKSAEVKKKPFLFSEKCRKFPDVGQDDQVNIRSYLDSVESVASFIGEISIIFAPIKSDILKNCKIVRDFINRNTKIQNLKEVLEEDLKSNPKPSSLSIFGSAFTETKEDKKGPREIQSGSTTEALMWIQRSMLYIHDIILGMFKDYEEKKCEENLVKYFKHGWDEFLAPHQTWYMSAMYNTIVHLIPNKTQFLQQITGTEKYDEKDLIKCVHEYLEQMGKVNENNQKKFIELNYKV